jgi:hypothetical protein
VRNFKLFIIISFFLSPMGQTVLFAQTPTPESPGVGPPILLTKNSIKFHPAAPETGDKLTLQIKMNERVASAEIRWSVNGDPLETVLYDGSAESVGLNKEIKSGDVIQAEVIPYDMVGAAGIPISKKVICRKAPPTMKLVEQKIDGNVYSAKVEAKDPEGEPLTLTVTGPQGMVIDQKGAISWKFSQTTSGKFDVKVTAKDKTGGRAELAYSFRISRR